MPTKLNPFLEFGLSIDDGWKTHELARANALQYLLPDGSRLSDPQNSHLLDTILRIAYAHARAAPSDTPDQMSYRMIQESMILVQWMFCRSIYWFQHLTPEDIVLFIKDYHKGLDHTICATSRIVNVIEGYEAATTSGKKLPMPSMSEIFDSANVPREYMSKVTFATSIARAYISRESWSTMVRPESKIVKLKASRAHAILGFFNELYAYRDGLPDYLADRPDEASLRRLVAEIASPKGQTRTMPHEPAMKSIADSIRWVTELGPMLIEAQNQIREAKQSSEFSSRRVLQKQISKIAIAVRAMGYKFDVVGRAGSPTEVSLYSLCYVHFRSACFTVCASLTGRRWKELMSLWRSGLSGTDEYGYSIATSIGKRAMDDKTPCPSLVARAVELLIGLNRAVGTSEDDFNVWKLPMLSENSVSGKYKPFRAEMLQQFAELLGHDRYEGENGIMVWKIAPHQYRRQFACIYFWRYDDPSLIALSVHFRHIDMQMIRTYINDPEMRKLFELEGKRFTIEVMRRVSAGETESYGVFGKVLARSIERMRTTMRVADARSAQKIAQRLTEQRGLVVHATPWGYCAAKASASNIRRAACQQPGTPQRTNFFTNAPDATASCEALCAGCHFHMTNESRRIHWQQKTQAVSRSQEQAAPNSQMHSALGKQKTILERFFRNSFGKAD
jgi:hypothetical protein